MSSPSALYVNCTRRPGLAESPTTNTSREPSPRNAGSRIHSPPARTAGTSATNPAGVVPPRLVRPSRCSQSRPALHLLLLARRHFGPNPRPKRSFPCPPRLLCNRRNSGRDGLRPGLGRSSPAATRRVLPHPGRRRACARRRARAHWACGSADQAPLSKVATSSHANDPTKQSIVADRGVWPEGAGRSGGKRCQTHAEAWPISHRPAGLETPPGVSRRLRATRPLWGAARRARVRRPRGSPPEGRGSRSTGHNAFPRGARPWRVGSTLEKGAWSAAQNAYPIRHTRQNAARSGAP